MQVRTHVPIADGADVSHADLRRDIALAVLIKEMEPVRLVPDFTRTSNVNSTVTAIERCALGLNEANLLLKDVSARSRSVQRD